MSALRKYHIPVPGALLALLAFFLPWISVGCEGLMTVEASGYNLASGNLFTELDSLLGSGSAPVDPGMFVILWAIPVVAVISLALAFWTMRQPDKERTTAIGHIVAGVAGVVVLAYIWLQSGSSSGSSDELSVLAGELVKFKYGLWLTVAGLLILIIGGILSFLEARAGAYGYGMTATDGVYQMPVGMPETLGAAPSPIAPAGDAPIGTHLSTGGQTYSASLAGSGPDLGGMGSMGAPPRRATEVLKKAEPVNMAWLVMKEGARAGHSFPLSEATSIGRDTNNDIIIDDNSMSGQHAKVKFEDGKFFTLTDLASTNGTFVFDRQKNDWEKVYRVELSDGMEVKLGRTVLHFMTLAGREAEGKSAPTNN